MGLSLFVLTSALFVFAAPIEGQLFLGVCPRPPAHMHGLDMELYSGQWYVAATTSIRADHLACGKVEYTFDPSKNHLKLEVLGNSPFESESKTGHVAVKSDNQKDLELSLDDFPRKWHFYVLSTNYDGVAVEYKCLDGVFKSTYDVTVLTRGRPPVEVHKLLEEHKLRDIVPPELYKKLTLVRQQSCPKPLLRPCPRAANASLGKVAPVKPSPFVTLVATILSGWP